MSKFYKLCHKLCWDNMDERNVNSFEIIPVNKVRYMQKIKAAPTSLMILAFVHINRDEDDGADDIDGKVVDQKKCFSFRWKAKA